jgi:hypothetical protein
MFFQKNFSGPPQKIKVLAQKNRFTNFNGPNTETGISEITLVDKDV